MTLPDCPYRKEIEPPGYYLCHGPGIFFSNNNHRISGELCLDCPIGIGKKTKASQPPRTVKANSDGPGQWLKWAIRTVTGQEPTSGCQCAARAKQLTEWGWLGSWERRDTVAAWLAEEAGRLGISVEPTVEALILKARELLAARNAVIPESDLDRLGQLIDRNLDAATVMRLAWARWGKILRMFGHEYADTILSNVKDVSNS